MTNEIVTAFNRSLGNGAAMGKLFADATLSNSAVTSLKQLVADGMSMRGTNWAKAFKADDDGEAELDYIKAANNLLKRGFNPDALIAAIQAASRQAA